ncbi:unnamed protein product [Pleuronectes platessa]|uniref:Uncharacterized protein n=1 Tax=Pleuronectes platessa TaxID=8262 RepID=A0A9N7TYS3_PLEPL|nr:unnamed protein product [Pleuronectes platessa]
MRAARKALRGATERPGEGVPLWRRQSYLFVSSWSGDAQTLSRELAWPVVDPAACRGGLRLVAPHLYSLLTGTSLQNHLLTGTWGAVGLGEDPAASKKVLVWGVDGGEGRGGIHSRSLSLQKPTHRHQPPPARLGRSQFLSSSRGHRQTPLLFWRRRSSRRLLQSLPRAGGSRANATPVPASEVLIAPAPVPVPRWKFSADVLPVLASGSSRHLLQSLSHTGGSRLTSLLFRHQRSSRRLLQSLPHAGGSRLTSLLFRQASADTTPVEASEAPAECAPVPVPRRRVQAGVARFLALAVLAAPILFPVTVATPVPAPHAGLRSEPLFSAPDWSPGRLSEELSCFAPDWPQGHPPEPKNSALERPQGRPPEPLNSALERPGCRPPEPLNCALERLARTYGLCLSKYEYELPIKESF